jgi:signal peptidase I
MPALKFIRTLKASGSAAQAPAIPRGKRRVRGVAREALLLAGLGLGLFALIRGVVGQTFLIPSRSMEGTLVVGDYILASPAVYGFRLPGTDARIPGPSEPAVGDVVVFRPDFYEPRIDILKRIVGTAGDTLRMTGRVLFRNGVRVAEPYVGGGRTPDVALPADGPLGQGWQRAALAPGVDRAAYRATRDNWGPLVVPPGEYFLLGDNRDASSDSRHLGFVPREAIRARVLWVLHSVDPAMDQAFPAVLRGARWNRSGRRVL